MSHYPKAAFVLSVGQSGQFPPDAGVEIAIAGRSNAGKSSAINALVGHQGLARTSKTPGRTRLLNYFDLVPGQRLVDLPGYGYAEGAAAERGLWGWLATRLAGREALRGLLLVVDARRGLRPGDLALMGWAEALPIHVLLSKCDKLNRSEAAAVLAQTRAQLATRGTAQLFSATHGTGLPEARGVLDRWLAGDDRDGKKKPR